MDLTRGFTFLFEKVEKIFLSPGSAFSVTSLACALIVAIAFVVVRRRRRNRTVRLRTILHALFPSRITASASHSLDVGYFFFNTFVFSLIFGGAILSYQAVSNATIAGLVNIAGQTQPAALHDIVPRIAITLVLFLAYELAYWIDHYLSHRVPFLWEFHKVHHEAEVLTPVTNFRVHPVDALLHANITALIMGIANGAMNYAFGKTAYQYAIADSNAIFVLFVHAYVHLQHTHLWIPFRGVWGRLFISPAHHQIHHSTNPAHFNKNMGSCLAIWDWMFGTLHVPAKEPEKLIFGVEQERPVHHDVHAMSWSLVLPFIGLWGLLTSALGRDRAAQDASTAVAPSLDLPRR
ncbi:MAG: sterol desaturase family protein [Pseudorhodoplanes sp.]|nr:sterol desaturase family protein [Pseudorhodoplanes sp.]MCL4712646.1 sterol desaturase family protein [Pseudorhodoplanes sp.]GIK81444.1 MAG: sterol desaturase [Alphaproteobacteria bacterium]